MTGARPSFKFTRYFVRCRVDANLVVQGWDVCDTHKFDMIEVATFEVGNYDKAEAVARLLNKQWEIDNGIPE